MCLPRLRGAVNITPRISKWAVLAAPRTGQDQSFRIVQGRPCYMYARSLPIQATDSAAINSQRRCNASQGPNVRILDLIYANSIENLGVNIFLFNALWLMYTHQFLIYISESDFPPLETNMCMSAANIVDIHEELAGNRIPPELEIHASAVCPLAKDNPQLASNTYNC